MKSTAPVIAQVEMTAVAKPAPGQTIQELIKVLEESGNTIMEVYADGVLIGLYSGGLEVGG